MFDFPSVITSINGWSTFVLSDTAPERLHQIAANLRELTPRQYPEDVLLGRLAHVLYIAGDEAEALAITAGQTAGLALAQRALILASISEVTALDALAGPHRAWPDGAGRHSCGWEAQMRLEYALAACYDRIGQKVSAEQHYDRALLIAEEEDCLNMQVTILSSRAARQQGSEAPEETLRRLTELLELVRRSNNRNLEGHLIDNLASLYASNSDYQAILKVVSDLPAGSDRGWMYAATESVMSLGLKAPPALDLAPRHPLMLLAHADYGLTQSMRAQRLFNPDEAHAYALQVTELPVLDTPEWETTCDNVELLRGLALIRTGELRAATAHLHTLNDNPRIRLPNTVAYRAALALELFAAGGTLPKGSSARAALTALGDNIEKAPPRLREIIAAVLLAYMPVALGMAVRFFDHSAIAAAVAGRAVQVGPSGATYRGQPVRKYPQEEIGMTAIQQAEAGLPAGGDNTAAQNRRRHRAALIALDVPPVIWEWRVDATVRRMELHYPPSWRDKLSVAVMVKGASAGFPPAVDL